MSANWTPPDPASYDLTRRVVFVTTDKEYETLASFAQTQGATVSAVIRAALRFYIDAKPDESPAPADYEGGI